MVTLQTANGFDLTGSFNPDQVTKIRFEATTSKLQANGGVSFMRHFDFTGQRGTVHIAGGVLELQGTSALSRSNADFLIGDTFYVYNMSAVVQLRDGAGITVASGATMVVETSPDVTIFDTLNSGAILENHGTFSYIGSAGTTTTFAMPFLNHGQATFDTGNFVFDRSGTATSNYGIMMDGGSIILKNGIDLRAKNGYYQTGGTLSTADTVAATITLLGTQNTAQINGGLITLGGANAYGKLTFTGGTAPTLNFNGGRFDAEINGQTSNQQDQLVCSGNINVQGNSTLVVTSVGAVAQLKTWRIMIAQSGNGFNDFANKTLPGGVTTNGAQLTRGFYQLDS